MLSPLFFFFTAACVTDVFVVVHTSGVSGGDSNGDYDLEVRVNGITHSVELTDSLPGDQAQSHKGDLWEFSLKNDLGFTSPSCIRKSNIEEIAIEESTNDGWHIDSVITVLKSGSNYQVATLDMEADQWIDGSGSPSSQPGVTKRFVLNKII